MPQITITFDMPKDPGGVVSALVSYSEQVQEWIMDARSNGRPEDARDLQDTYWMLDRIIGHLL